MIGLACLLNNPDGAFLLSELSSSDLYKQQRRYQRVATLDGGVAVELRGLFDCDRVMSVVVPFNSDLLAQLSSYSKWTVATREGCFVMLLTGWDVTATGIQLALESL